MKLKVYLSNGSILDFVLTDFSAEQDIVAEINEGRLFSGKSLIFGSRESCTMLQSVWISRIDIVSSAPLVVPRTLEGTMTPIENDDEFQKRAMQAKLQHREGVTPGEAFEGFLQFSLAGNHRLMLSIQGVLRDQLQFFTNLRRAFETPFMWFGHPAGGLIILNVANVLSISSVPGFSQYPRGSLLVDPAGQ